MLFQAGHTNKGHRLVLGVKHEMTKSCGTIIRVTTYMIKTSIRIVVIITFTNKAVEEYGYVSN